MWKLHYLLSVLSFILAVILISKLLRQRRAPGSTVAWLLVMILIPHLGVPLYLILGNRKIRLTRKKKRGLYQLVPYAATSRKVLPTERMLLASGAPERSTGNQVILLTNGVEAYLELTRQIRQAKSRIHIATFILKRDSVGKEILQILEEKARSGVQVRLLLDGLGSFWTFRWRLKSLREAGGRFAYFLPLVHIPFFGHSNLRNHRKIVVTDGKNAIIGGMNLAREYMGPTSDPHQWVDLSLSISGPAVRDLEDIFLADWEFASGESIERRFEEPEENGTQVVQVVASGPDVSSDPLYDSIVSAIFDAKKSIWIATPYYIPDETLSKALELASRRGVDVRLLIPRRSNHVLADISRSGYLKLLEQAGGQIFYLPERMMHAKLLIVDHLYTILGSANMDMRSLLLNYESGVFLYSEPSIQTVCKWYESLIQESIRQPLKHSFGSEVIEGLGRILGPIL